LGLLWGRWRTIIYGVAYVSDAVPVNVLLAGTPLSFRIDVVRAVVPVIRHAVAVPVRRRWRGIISERGEANGEFGTFIPEELEAA